MPNPSLRCFLLVGCCLSCLGSFVAFFGGDAKSLAWVFLARRVLPFVFGFFFGLFWWRCQIPRLGVSCWSGAAFRAWILLLPFLGAMPNPSLGCFLLVGCCLSCLRFFCWPFLGGDAKSLAWVFLARRVLTKWMVMGSVYLELFETKPCCILVCPIIPYVLWNTIL